MCVHCRTTWGSSPLARYSYCSATANSAHRRRIVDLFIHFAYHLCVCVSVFVCMAAIIGTHTQWAWLRSGLSFSLHIAVRATFDGMAWYAIINTIIVIVWLWLLLLLHSQPRHGARRASIHGRFNQPPSTDSHIECVRLWQLQFGSQTKKTPKVVDRIARPKARSTNNGATTQTATAAAPVRLSAAKRLVLVNIRVYLFFFCSFVF